MRDRKTDTPDRWRRARAEGFAMEYSFEPGGAFGCRDCDIELGYRVVIGPGDRRISTPEVWTVVYDRDSPFDREEPIPDVQLGAAFGIVPLASGQAGGRRYLLRSRYG